MAGILRPPLFPWHASRGHGRTEDFPLKKKKKRPPPDLNVTRAVCHSAASWITVTAPNYQSIRSQLTLAFIWHKERTGLLHAWFQAIDGARAQIFKILLPGWNLWKNACFTWIFGTEFILSYVLCIRLCCISLPFFWQSRWCIIWNTDMKQRHGTKRAFVCMFGRSPWYWHSHFHSNSRFFFFLFFQAVWPVSNCIIWTSSAH